MGRNAPGADRWREDHTCSYCGSISPAKFFEAIDAGCQLGPTDQTYKVYVDLPHSDPTGIRLIGHTSMATRPSDGWEPVTDTLRQEFGNSISPHDTFILRGQNGPHIHAKFYFQHLSEAERDRFIELHKAGKMNIGYPGHFYVTPLFCARRGDAPAGAK